MKPAVSDGNHSRLAQRLRHGIFFHLFVRLAYG
jgi:hypothetical protein